MIAHKCDRCGKLYESYNMDENYLEINAMYTLNRDMHKGGRHEHGPFDLCPDCSKELVDWLYKFTKEETEIEEETEVEEIEEEVEEIEEETGIEPETEEPTPKEHTIRRAAIYNCYKKVLYPPKNFIPYNCDRTKYKTEVRVDACLVNEIEELWKKGIRTMGSCCGHGRHLGMIQVLPEDTKKMVALGYEFYIYPEDYNFSRADTFIPKSYGHDYCGYTDSYLG